MTAEGKTRIRHGFDLFVYYAGAVAVVLIAIVAVLGFIDRLDRVEQDKQARFTSCIVTQVLEVSRERARQEGNLDGQAARLYAQAFAVLPRDCPRLIQIPPDIRQDTPEETP